MRKGELLMLRTSSYIIYIELPNDPDNILLIHGYTGSSDKVSQHIAQYLRAHETHAPAAPLHGMWSSDSCVIPESPSLCDDTIAFLQRRGYLTQRSRDEETSMMRVIAKALHERTKKGVPHYVIMPTYNCNLRCAYCFQDHMRTEPRYRHLLRLMTPAVADRIIEAFPQIEEVHGQDSALITRDIWLFGGEPLLRETLPIVSYMLDKIRMYGRARFFAVTNGTELDHFAPLLGTNAITYLQVTLDGPPEEHDKRRIYADGSGSFHKIADNITMALEKGVTVSVRINIDKTNIHYVSALSEVIHHYGWDARTNFSVYTAPIHASNNQTSKSTTLDSWQLRSELTNEATTTPLIQIVEKPDSALERAMTTRFRAPAPTMPSLHSTYCSAHSTMYVFDAFADIYACWEKTGDRSIRLGYIDEMGQLQINAEINELWRSRNIGSNGVCVKCKYALHCGGGCAAYANDLHGTYHSNYCDGFAKRFKTSVAHALHASAGGAQETQSAYQGCPQ